MVTKKVRSKKNTVSKKNVSEKISPAFFEALRNIESMGKELIEKSIDPFKMGCRIANEIRDVADRVENEAMAEGISLTEASYYTETVVGVGVGVI
ncbi:MAG TPA: hypothetical protein PLX88_04950 [Syntrophorhabdaceae bacterium]|jgi:hypothetical protein|nr:hypothetical protein [Syntrophorhabdaceae bacterium]MDI9560128.1 hypothetical protein [Pseudomonadota bacterium]OQC49721.1 MAG: hypothetical protein BWX58_00632 [Deltaproteobacteria bacterium ADurb.Bin026]MBV6506234.1 hypothetical protein [Syntrophorhabdaceae bacterium]HNZ58753.1 hypothetical protein [Syntrophorhabdaceae bacterium]